MAVKIRLARHGRKKRPYYRIVVADSRAARDGRFIDIIGTYNPILNPAKVQVDQTKTFKWLGEGAIMTGTVEKILERSGVLAKYKAGEPVSAEESKITLDIFAHPLDEHGSKRKGPRKQAATMTAEAEAAGSKTPAEEPARADTATDAPEAGESEEKSE
ncbi:MAG: 30S ribosomal protein S16 [Candidatus Eisenbacteria bacterium]